MFHATMITVDRSPKQNFLRRTLENLTRSGVFASPLLDGFTIVDSGSRVSFIDDATVNVERDVAIDSAVRVPTENAARALKLGAESGSPWVLFLEDDIDVCGRFVESTAAWLGEHERAYKVFPLGANYDAVKGCVRRGERAWPYGVAQYYGTLAVAMRRETAADLAAFLAERAHRQEYDLLMAEWARGQGISHFLTPAPSFVQHIGVESVIRPGSVFHTYETWPGPTWIYESPEGARR